MEEFPDLDELQWLEQQHSPDPEPDIDDEYDYSPPPPPPPQPIPQQKEKEKEKQTPPHFPLSPPPFSPQPETLNRKRPRPTPLPPYPEHDNDHIKARVRVSPIDISQQNEDDDWEQLPYHLYNNNNNNGVVDVVEVEEEDGSSKYLSRFASEIEGDFVPVTAPDGYGSERVYAKVEKEVFSGVGKLGKTGNCGGLIAESVSVLLQKAEQDALLKALRASSELQSTLVVPESSAVTEELWVNKYAPKSFTELLSDEQTNREVLSWLKQWDPTVFGTDIINTENEVLCALRRHSSLPHHQKQSDVSFLNRSRGPMYAKKYMGHSAVFEHEDTRSKGPEGLQNKKQIGSGTPDQKVLLLCGPPGLGKTTLAHVAAKHCGYHVLEINASDDRSSTVLETKILDAVQMNSVLGDAKPKCLVIDEIDGALGDGKGAVEILLKMVAGDRKSNAGREASTSEEERGTKSLKKGRKAVSLSRPVICICNDLYAPSLRPLRNIAKVHVFAQPTVNRVVNRLKYICNKEGLKTSSISLTALAEYTECDIRSCLNTLQFLHKKKESLNLVALSSQVIGRKDMTRSVFDVWKEVFQKRKVKRNPKCDVSSIKTYDGLDSLYSLVSNRGDYELILDGIHENFLQMKCHDPMLQKTVLCLNALGVSDLLHQSVMRSHNMSLYAYYPPITITMHHLLARVERSTIEWPKSFHRYRTSLTEKRETLRSWQCTITPCISRHLSMDSFVKDTASLFLHILSPVDLRPVALHLMSDREKNDLAQLVSTMVSYSLTYKDTKLDLFVKNSTHDETADASQLTFDPPIQGFVCFKDYKSGHYELKSVVKQVVVHEVENHKIVKESKDRLVPSAESSKRQSNSVSNDSNDILELHKAEYLDVSKERTKKMSQEDIGKPTFAGSSSFVGSSRTSADVVKRKSAGGVKKAPVSSFNFFDRFKRLNQKGVQDVDSPAEKSATVERDGRSLIFKFNEGFTNAVKRPVRMREFLL